MASTDSSPTRVFRKLPATQSILLPEVIERIFWHMDEGTFFIALQTCRQFSEAGSTRKNLLRQVGRLPGLRPGLEDLHGIDLRRKSRQRASTSGCMAPVLADIWTCRLPSEAMPLKSVFTTNSSREGNSQLALANDNGTIDLYNLANDDVRQPLTLRLRIHNDRQHLPQIAALAFSPRGHLLVLHGQGEYICGSKHRGSLQPHLQNSECEHACRIRKVYALTIFCHCERIGVDSTNCQMKNYRGQILALEGATPVGLAFSCTGSASIAWKLEHLSSGREYRIELLTTLEHDSDDLSASNGLGDSDDNYLLPDTTIIDPVKEMYHQSRNIFRMTFAHQGKKLLLRDNADPVHKIWRESYRDVRNQHCYHNVTSFETAGPEEVAMSFNIGYAFHGTHFSFAASSEKGSSYLALGIRDNNRSPPLGDAVRYLYILHYNDYIAPTVDIDTPLSDTHLYNPQWTVVALLAGWRENSGSMGSILDIAPGCNRIASTDWDRVLVWTFDPQPLHSGGLEHYFPPRDYNARKRLGRLRPIMLPRQGVVYALKWIDDDTLFALTDRGLVKWYIGPLASGKRNIDSAKPRRTGGGTE